MNVPGQRPPVPQLHRPSPPLCPITALAFYRARQHTQENEEPPSSSQGSSLYVLAGENGWLGVYSVDQHNSQGGDKPVDSTATGHCLGRLRVFAEQAIQGCRVGRSYLDEQYENGPTELDGDVLVWGGRSVALVSRTHLEHLLERGSDDDDQLGQERDLAIPPVKEVQAPDWIYDGLLPDYQSKDSPSSHGALVTAHNEVVRFRVDQGIEGAVPTLVLLTDASISPSRPVLYSAQLAWMGRSGHDKGHNRLLVAAGTVFGEIVVWTCNVTAADSAEDANSGIKVLHVFTGHEGSIFDVALSPELELNHGGSPTAPTKVRLLATCSDDRTVRVWPLHLNNSGSGNESDSGSNTSIRDATQARETGFQNTFDKIAARPQDEKSAESHTRKQQEPTESSSESSSALAVVMAHASRIWHVRFGAATPSSSHPSSPQSIFLYSFGEDATAQEWCLGLELGMAQTHSGRQLSGSLQHLRTLPCHTGKNIWSAAVSSPQTKSHPTLQGQVLVVTGACDGKICLFQGASGGQSSTVGGSTVVSSTVPPRHNSTIPTKPEEAQAETSQRPDGTPKQKKGSQKRFRQEVFNSYAFLSEDCMLAATTHGRLLIGSPDESDSTQEPTWIWTELPNMLGATVAELRDYNVVRSPRGGGGGGVAALPEVEGLAFIGSQTGKLFLYSLSAGLQELPVHLPGKVDEILFLPEERQTSKTAQTLRLQLLVTVLFQDEVALLDVGVDTVKGTLVSHTSRTLHLPKKAPLSPSSMAITAASRCGGCLVLGSRTGQLCAYKAEKDGDNEHTTTGFALSSQTQSRTRDAILSIVPLPPAAGSQASAAFVVTARDGTYRIYEMVDQADAVDLCMRHETAPPFGPIVRDAWFIHADAGTAGGGGGGGGGGGAAAAVVRPELILCGFRSTKFVVWNETRQQTLATVECGGTHRAHTYLFCLRDMGRLRFAFTRNSNLHVFSQAASAMASVKTGGHGREIRAVRASATGRYIATGGEDTVVRIWAHASPPRCLSVLKLHNTGLHGLVWLGDDCLVSAAGSEELFVWRIAGLPSAYDGLAVLCESAYPDSTDDKVLRITGLDASLDVLSPSSSAMYISVALSNSVLKTYRYAQGEGWTLLAQGSYTGACPMQVRHLQQSAGKDLVVLAAFADGNLSVWKAAHTGGGGSPYGDYTLLCMSQVHRNAVKALDLSSAMSSYGQTSSLSPSWLDIVTGGDDNAIAVTRLSWTDGEEGRRYTFDKTFRVSNAHAAALTGIQLLKGVAGTPDETAGSSITALSCSNDQRIKAWKIAQPCRQSSNNDESSRVHVQLLDNKNSAVADPGDLECIGGSDSLSAIVVGIGMETWRLG